MLFFAFFFSFGCQFCPPRKKVDYNLQVSIEKLLHKNMQTKQIEQNNTDLIKLRVLEKCLLKKQEIPKFKFLCSIHLISEILGSKPRSFPKSHDIAKLVIKPQEDLAKFGYRANMKVEKRKKIVLYSIKPATTCCRNLAIQFFFFFPSNSSKLGPIFSQ